MTKIAICDDELQEIERAQGMLVKYNQENPQYNITIVTFVAPLELLSYVEKHGGFDVFLLDVYMAGLLGTEAARQLRQLGDCGEIVFMTSSKDHALDAFEVDAAQYLIKPYTEKAFFSALDKVFSRINIERRHLITFKTSDGIARIFARDVIFTETCRNNYQMIHTTNKRKYEVRMTAGELFELLMPVKSFVRCGASINLNLRYIRQIKKEILIFDSGEQLAYPYRAYQMLKEAFLSFQMSPEE
jgi:DNA-binding LytR/AlgR family response regulator